MKAHGGASSAATGWSCRIQMGPVMKAWRYTKLILFSKEEEGGCFQLEMDSWQDFKMIMKQMSYEHMDNKMQ
jgi:hypothetical protein